MRCLSTAVRVKTLDNIDPLLCVLLSQISIKKIFFQDGEDPMHNNF